MGAGGSSKGKFKTTLIILSRKDIENQFGNTIKEAAKNLNVSQSTLRRKSKDLGISRWPKPPKSRKRNENDSHASSCGSCCVPPNHLMGFIGSDRADPNGPYFVREEDDGATQQLTIKAIYDSKMIKLVIPILETTLLLLEKEIGMELNLIPGTFTLQYIDEDDDLISLTSESAMGVCIECLRKSCRSVVRVYVVSSISTIL